MVFVVRALDNVKGLVKKPVRSISRSGRIKVLLVVPFQNNSHTRIFRTADSDDVDAATQMAVHNAYKRPFCHRVSK